MPKTKQTPALALLKGNPGRRPVNPSPAVAPPGAVDPPASLGQAARVLWDELAPIAIAMGTLTPADRRPFAAFCELQASLEGISKAKADASGGYVTVVRDEADGDRYVLVVDAVLKAERDAAVACLRFYALFGFEPAARGRLVVGAPAAPVQSKWR